VTARKDDNELFFFAYPRPFRSFFQGEVPRYTGIINCFTRVSQEQGVGALWRGNMANVVRYFREFVLDLSTSVSIACDTNPLAFD
jgi:hypothetical protein